MLTLRDPIHGFIRCDPLESALVNSRPVQRLRNIHQLGLTFLVFPGAEHSRFSHVLGAMHLAGRVYDALAAELGESFPISSDEVEDLADWCCFEELVNRLASELDLPALRKLQLLIESLPDRALSVLSILRSRQQVVDLLRPYRHLAITSLLN